jgi:S-adenosylmethionine hydrolase
MRPVITFLTDFGPAAPAVCRGVMFGICPDANIIDINHQVPRYSIRAGAGSLVFALPQMPVGIHVAIVDPGVGTARRPVAVTTIEEGRFLVGPDNGLLAPAIERFGGAARAIELSRSPFRLEPVSRTFHGRDLFSPAAAHLARGVAPEALGPPLDPEGLVSLDVPEPVSADGALVATLLYLDSFGNVALNITRDDVEKLGIVSGTRVELEISGERYYAVMARTFADARPGDVILYEDSYANMSVAISRGSAARMLHAAPGQKLRITPVV